MDIYCKPSRGCISHKSLALPRMIFDIYCNHSRRWHNHQSQALQRMVVTFTVNIEEDGMIINHKLCREWY